MTAKDSPYLGGVGQAGEIVIAVGLHDRCFAGRLRLRVA